MILTYHPILSWIIQGEEKRKEKERRMKQGGCRRGGRGRGEEKENLEYQVIKIISFKICN